MKEIAFITPQILFTEVMDNEIILKNIKKVNENIGNGRTKEALKVLEDAITQIGNREYSESVILLKNRFNELQKYRIEVGEDKEISKNKLNRDIVNFTANIEDSLLPNSRKESGDKVSFIENISLLIISGISTLIIGWGIIILADSGFIHAIGMAVQFFGLLLCLIFIIQNG